MLAMVHAPAAQATERLFDQFASWYPGGRCDLVIWEGGGEFVSEIIGGSDAASKISRELHCIGMDCNNRMTLPVAETEIVSTRS